MKTNTTFTIGPVLYSIFKALYETGAHTLIFSIETFDAEAERLGNFYSARRLSLTDFICYDPSVVSTRRRQLPSRVRKTEPSGWQWRLRRVSADSYAFCLEPLDSIYPSKFPLLEHCIPDATPEIITCNSLSDEQALLARVRYNRLIDIFLGVTAYSLQNHLRTTVKSLGQIEIDEVYVGIDRHGCQYIIPVQAKGGNDQLSTVQAKQDIACCAEKFPDLVCRAISAQFMDDSRIAMFELCLDDDGLVKTVEERHYLLVPADQIGSADLERYRKTSR